MTIQWPELQATICRIMSSFNPDNSEAAPKLAEPPVSAERKQNNAGQAP